MKSDMTSKRLIHENTESINICFSGFDSVSKKLIISLFKANRLRPEVLDDFNFKDADICLFNYESIPDKTACNQVKDSLIKANKHLILFTSDDSVISNVQTTVVLKPKERGGIADYLLNLKTIIQSVISHLSEAQIVKAEIAKEKITEENLIQQKISQPILTKSIIKRHLSNAINPSQIQFDRNRFHAQKHVGSQADIDMDDELQLKKIQLNPESYLFNYLKKAFEKSQKDKLAIGMDTAYGVFIVDAENNFIFTNKQANELKSIHNVPLLGVAQVTLERIKDHDLNKLNNLNKFGYESFIWQSAIKASKGRIPTGVNHNQPVVLNGWPNLTQLLIFKYAIQIISLWSRGHYSLIQTPKLLRIPQRYVTTVYTALDSLGLIRNDALGINRRVKNKPSL